MLIALEDSLLAELLDLLDLVSSAFIFLKLYPFIVILSFCMLESLFDLETTCSTELFSEGGFNYCDTSEDYIFYGLHLFSRWNSLIRLF